MSSIPLEHVWRLSSADSGLTPRGDAPHGGLSPAAELSFLDFLRWHAPEPAAAAPAASAPSPGYVRELPSHAPSSPNYGNAHRPGETASPRNDEPSNHDRSAAEERPLPAANDEGNRALTEEAANGEEEKPDAVRSESADAEPNASEEKGEGEFAPAAAIQTAVHARDEAAGEGTIAAAVNDAPEDAKTAEEPTRGAAVDRQPTGKPNLAAPTENANAAGKALSDSPVNVAVDAPHAPASSANAAANERNAVQEASAIETIEAKIAGEAAETEGATKPLEQTAAVENTGGEIIERGAQPGGKLSPAQQGAAAAEGAARAVDAQSSSGKRQGEPSASRGAAPAKIAAAANEAAQSAAPAATATDAATAVFVEAVETPQAAPAAAIAAGEAGAKAPANANLTANGTAATTEPPKRGMLPFALDRGERVPEGARLTQADHARLVQRVARAIEAAQGREGWIKLKLSPPELGSLQLEVKVEQGALAARLEAESNATRNALLENLPQLRERLAEQGIRIERFDVDVSERQSNGAPRDGSERNAAHEGGARGRNDERRESREQRESANESPKGLTHRGSLNVTA